MMMNNQKKMAMLIVKGLGSKEPSSSYSPKEDVAVKDDSEKEESPEEVAAQELIDAVHSKDASGVVAAMKALMELCSEDSNVEHVDSSPEGE